MLLYCSLHLSDTLYLFISQMYLLLCISPHLIFLLESFDLKMVHRRNYFMTISSDLTKMKVPRKCADWPINGLAITKGTQVDKSSYESTACKWC